LYQSMSSNLVQPMGLKL